MDIKLGSETFIIVIKNDLYLWIIYNYFNKQIKYAIKDSLVIKRVVVMNTPHELGVPSEWGG